MESSKEHLDMPGGSVPEYQRWQTRSRQLDGADRAYIDLDGTTHPLQEGERFSVRLDRAANRYDAVVTKSDGTQMIVGSGPMMPGGPSSPKQPDIAQQPLNINRERLREIFAAASERGALFGRQVILTDADKADITTIADEIQHYVESQIGSDPEWQKFQTASEELLHAGEGSGTFPPSWLVVDKKVSSVRSEVREIQAPPGTGNDSDTYKRTVIIVPENIYNAYYWLERCSKLRNSLSGQSGTSAIYFRKELSDASDFLKQIGRL